MLKLQVSHPCSWVNQIIGCKEWKACLFWSRFFGFFFCSPWSRSLLRIIRVFDLTETLPRSALLYFCVMLPSWLLCSYSRLHYWMCNIDCRVWGVMQNRCFVVFWIKFLFSVAVGVWTQRYAGSSSFMFLEYISYIFFFHVELCFITVVVNFVIEIMKGKENSWFHCNIINLHR